MTQPIQSSSVTSFATELAELLIQNETTQSDSDRSTRDAARATFLQDAQHQVDELHASASATEMGALVGAVSAVASGAFSIGAADAKFDAETASPCDTGTIVADNREASVLQAISGGFSNVATPVKTMVFDTAASNDQANAKHFETLAEQAKWQSDDATTEINKADSLGGKILDIVQSLNQDQSSATNAVIGRI
jgi:hypothetical protein